MNTILISYRLEQNVDESQINDRIKRYPNWARIFNRFWIIKTRNGVGSVRDELEYAIHGRGEIFVINVTDSAWASFKLDKDLSKWIHDNL